MKKLIFYYAYGDCEANCGESTIPFEYKSKEDFIFDVLEKFDNKFFKENNYAMPFGDSGSWLQKKDIERIEKMVFTVEEFFEKNELIPQLN